MGSATTRSGSEPLDESALGCPVPRPRQVFAIGLNYRSHAEESGMAVPEVPATFTKFPASLSGPFDDIEIVGDTVDWEVELVAVIGRRADRVDEADGWDHVAGLTVGQDISDRTLQFAAGSQFSLGKSQAFEREGDHAEQFRAGTRLRPSKRHARQERDESGQVPVFNRNRHKRFPFC